MKRQSAWVVLMLIGLFVINSFFMAAGAKAAPAQSVAPASSVPVGRGSPVVRLVDTASALRQAVPPCGLSLPHAAKAGVWHHSGMIRADITRWTLLRRALFVSCGEGNRRRFAAQSHLGHPQQAPPV